MALLKKEQIKEIVEAALKAVADFNGDINNYEFTHFHDTHKQAFLNKLKEKINGLPYYKRDGTIDTTMYYDVPLSLNILNSWNTMQDCISYINDNHTGKNNN